MINLPCWDGLHNLMVVFGGGLLLLYLHYICFQAAASDCAYLVNDEFWDVLGLANWAGHRGFKLPETVRVHLMVPFGSSAHAESRGYLLKPTQVRGPLKWKILNS